MGIFATNRLSSMNEGFVDFDVTANESYNCSTGCAFAAFETEINDMKLFEAAITSDINNIAAVNEGVEVLNESASDVFKKIKEFFIKLLEKIKGIFKSFMAKISGVFMDSRKLYDRYKTTISKNSNWKDFKVKNFRKAKSDDIVGAIEKAAEYKFDNTDYTFAVFSDDTKLGDIKYTDIISKDNTIDSDDIMDNLIKKRIENTTLKNGVSADLKDLHKEFMDVIFDDEETKDEWSTTDILHGCVGDLLNTADKSKRAIEKGNANMEATVKKIVEKVGKEAEKVSKVLSNIRLKKGSDNEYAVRVGSPSSEESRTGKKRDNAEFKDLNAGAKYNKAEDVEKIERLAGFYQRVASAENTLVTRLTSERLSAIKFAITQARRVWSSAAAYASVDRKNESAEMAHDYDYYTAVGEAYAYDSETEFEAIC